MNNASHTRFCSLYKCTPNQQAINALLEHVRRDPEARVPPTPFTIIDKLLEMILNMNHFEFNMKRYLKMSGSAMGNLFFTSLANIFMGRFEKVLMENYHLQPLLFIDDIGFLDTRVTRPNYQ